MEKGSSSSAGLDSLNGLKFGKKIYFEGAGSGLHPKAGGAKKGRTSGVQPPRCVVDGCEVDLSNAKAYYSRHKVCSMHSKSPKVTVAGHEQRFCQQCSRFHELPEFDQGKRSCRRRLAGHNERRRKPPPPLGYACFSPSFFEDRSSRAGGFVMDFSGRDSWPSPGNHASITAKYHLPPQGSSQNPLPRPTYSNGCFNQLNALSLLSTQPWPRSTTLGPSNFLQQPSLTPPQFAFNHDALPPHQPPFTGDLGLPQPNDAHFHQLHHSRAFDMH